jgi:hypothetical protein
MDYSHGVNMYDDTKTVELMKVFRENMKKVGWYRKLVVVPIGLSTLASN